MWINLRTQKIETTKEYRKGEVSLIRFGFKSSTILHRHDVFFLGQGIGQVK
jgi:hypothetical protein